jgi:hypothetical protein
MSPTIFKEAGYRFFFFSREKPRMHVHIISGDGEAKFWLEPEIELAKNYHFSRIQLKEIESLVECHYNELVSAGQQHFGG